MCRDFQCTLQAALLQVLEDLTVGVSCMMNFVSFFSSFLVSVDFHLSGHDCRLMRFSS